jgi:hypothetical protein
MEQKYTESYPRSEALIISRRYGQEHFETF